MILHAPNWLSILNVRHRLIYFTPSQVSGFRVFQQVPSHAIKFDRKGRQIQFREPSGGSMFSGD